jgi:hypothetical protein
MAYHMWKLEHAMKTYQISVKGRLMVLLSGHYCQEDGSCQCGWIGDGNYPGGLHPGHLAIVIENELKPELNRLAQLEETHADR